MSSETNLYKKAINHTAIYGAADIIRKIVGFLMLPIYTRYLTPSDYGVVELMMMTIFVVEIFFGMRMGQAVFRYYSLAKDANEKKTVMSTAYLMTFCASTIAFIILATNTDSATSIMLGDSKYADLMIIFAIILITQPIEEYGLIYVRVHQRAALFFGLSISKLIISLSLNIYFIVFLELSVAGVIYSACISSVMMAVFATIYTFYYSGINISKSLFKSLVIFSYPLWIAAVGALYSESAVKYFLRVFSSMEQVGIYALALKFASLIFIFVWNPFAGIWHSLKYEIYETSEPNLVYKNIFIILVLGLTFVGLGVALLSDTVIRLMADEAFWPAGDIVPILVMAKIVQALTNFNNFGILLKEKTGIIAVGTYLNAFLATIAFVILIPLVGLFGAAIAVLLGVILQLVWIEWRSKELYDMQLPWWRAAMMGLTWFVCYALSLLLPEALLISITGKLLILILYICLLFFMPILEKEEKEKIQNFVKAAIRKVSYRFFS